MERCTSTKRTHNHRILQQRQEPAIPGEETAFGTSQTLKGTPFFLTLSHQFFLKTLHMTSSDSLVIDRNPFSYIWSFCENCKENTPEDINDEFDLVCTLCALIKDRITTWEVAKQYTDNNGELVNSYAKDLDHANYLNTSVRSERLRFPVPDNPLMCRKDQTDGNVVWDETFGLRKTSRNRNNQITKYIGYKNQFHFNEILAQISTQGPATPDDILLLIKDEIESGKYGSDPRKLAFPHIKKICRTVMVPEMLQQVYKVQSKNCQSVAKLTDYFCTAE